MSRYMLKNRQHYQIGFDIWSRKHSVQEISDALKIRPSSSFGKGSIRKNGERAVETHWSYLTPLDQNALSIPKQLDRLKVVVRKTGVLRALPKGCSITFRLVVYYYAANGAFLFPERLARWIAENKVRFEVVVYPCCEE